MGQRREKSPGFVRALWIVNVVALVGLTAWVFCDAMFPHGAIQFRTALAALFGGPFSVDEIAAPLIPRAAILGGVLLVAACSLLGIAVGLFVGAPVHRRLRAWLAFTMLVAGWLALAVAWPELAWQGQRLRLRGSLDEFDAIAASLRDDWPTTDGERAGLGAFTAYPQGKPRMLMVLTSDTNPPISAVERADDWTLRFELRGDPGGAWLEWHPASSTPHPFVGGLENKYDLGRAASLGGGWYLVRYR